MEHLPQDNKRPPYAPAFLQGLPQWVCWRKEQRNGRVTKVPYNPKTGEHARTNDPASWCSYRDARWAWERNPERYSGMGFVFHGEFTGVDLDHCVEADGSIAAWARAYIKRLNTYAEFSPNDGVHLYVTGTIPKGLRRRIPNAPHAEAALEMYCSGRYFTVTGRTLQDMPLTAEPRQDELLAIYAELSGTGTPLHDAQPTLLTSQVAMAQVAREATRPVLLRAQDAMTSAALDRHPSGPLSALDRRPSGPLATQQAMTQAALDATQPALLKAQDAMTDAALSTPRAQAASTRDALAKSVLDPSRAEAASDTLAKSVLDPQRAQAASTRDAQGGKMGSAQQAGSWDVATLSDRELLQHVARTSKGATFKALWQGDITGYLSHSEADLALCNYLAFWTGNDAARVDRLFRRSRLYRADKWNRPARAGQTYGQGTVATACTGETYASRRVARSAAQPGPHSQTETGVSHASLPKSLTNVLAPSSPTRAAGQADTRVQETAHIARRRVQEIVQAVDGLAQASANVQAAVQAASRRVQESAQASADVQVAARASVDVQEIAQAADGQTGVPGDCAAQTVDAAEQVAASHTVERVEYLYAEDEPLDEQWWRPDSLPSVDVTFVQRCLEKNEDGDALLFAHLFKDRCVYDYINKTWYLWQGHFWEADQSKRVPRLVCEYVAHVYENAARRTPEMEVSKKLHGRAWSLRTVSRIKHVLTLTESIMPISAEQWDTNDWLLGTREGVLDLRTGEMRDGRPADYMRRVVQTTWRGLDEPAPRFEQFWRDLFADRSEQARDELIAFMQRVLGYGITGRVSEHIFLLFYGEEGRNGKDTLMQVLADVLGETVGVVNNDVLIASGRGSTPGSANSSLCQLQGRRIAWASETNQGARFDIGQVKYLTGGGGIAARELYGKAFAFQPSHLLVLLTNHKPHADASDAAFWERLCPIIFNQRFVDQPTAPNERQRDTTLVAALKAEASGILAWLVRGCLAWQSQGLAIPTEVRQARRDYHEEEDTLGSFIHECCILDPLASVGAAPLYTAYKAWALENGLKALNNNTFSLHMRKRVQWHKSKKNNFYTGIKLEVSEVAD